MQTSQPLQASQPLQPSQPLQTTEPLPLKSTIPDVRQGNPQANLALRIKANQPRVSTVRDFNSFYSSKDSADDYIDKVKGRERQQTLLPSNTKKKEEEGVRGRERPKTLSPDAIMRKERRKKEADEGVKNKERPKTLSPDALLRKEKRKKDEDESVKRKEKSQILLSEILQYPTGQIRNEKRKKDEDEGVERKEKSQSLVHPNSPVRKEKRKKEEDEAKRKERPQSLVHPNGQRNEQRKKAEDEESDDSVVFLNPEWDHPHSAVVCKNKEDSSMKDAEKSHLSTEGHDFDTGGREKKSHGKKLHSEHQSTGSPHPQTAINTALNSTTNTKSVYGMDYENRPASNMRKASRDERGNSHSRSLNGDDLNSRSQNNYKVDERYSYGSNSSSSSSRDKEYSSNSNERGSGKIKERSEIVNRESSSRNNGQPENRKSTQSSNHVPYRQKPDCRFFNSHSGCRSGNRCQFSHVEEDSVPYKKSRKD